MCVGGWVWVCGWAGVWVGELQEQKRSHPKLIVKRLLLRCWSFAQWMFWRHNRYGRSIKEVATIITFSQWNAERGKLHCPSGRNSRLFIGVWFDRVCVCWGNGGGVRVVEQSTWEGVWVEERAMPICALVRQLTTLFGESHGVIKKGHRCVKWHPSPLTKTKASQNDNGIHGNIHFMSLY